MSLPGAAGLAGRPRSCPATARAADWRPTEAVRIIVPAAPGGTTDLMGRLLAQHLQVAWGQSTVVENKSGGGGTIAMTDFVRQKPDGHTIMLGNPGPNAIAYSIFRNITYKPDQLQPVSNLIRTSNIVSAHPSVPVKSIPELIDYLKKNPDSLSYATSGTGQSPHLTAAWFLQLTGLKMAHVPFRGAGPALTAALGGQVPILFDNLFPSLPQVREGKLTGLATTMPERTVALARYPDHARERAGACEVRRLVVVRRVPAARRAAAGARCAQWRGQGFARPRRHEGAHQGDRRDRRPRRRRNTPRSCRPRSRNSARSSRRKSCRWTSTECDCLRSVLRRKRSAPSPRWGEGWGEGAQVPR